MPWDATRLRVAPILEDGTIGPSELAAGGPEESIVQPEWSPDGILHLVSDRSGWWNLYRILDGPRLEPLAPMEAEFADPSWIFDRSSYGFLADGSIVAVARSDGHDRLFHIRPGELVGEVESPFTELDGLRTGRVGGRRHRRLAERGRARRDVRSGDAGPVRRPATVQLREPGSGLGLGARAHRVPLDRRPHRPRPRLPAGQPGLRRPGGERPPLVVLSHGGPTSNASTALNLEIQLHTSRGIAVVDVDYAGSTGYGRAYRDALRGVWGIADLDDCVAAARFLVDRGDVDGERLAIEGGSSGGYTALAALAFRDVFAAGISYFGVGDLEALARDTHKFESRYLDRLVGPYPEAAAVYRQRSPVHYLDEISCPVLVLQGLDDKIVPPAQAEAIVAALAANHIPHAYLAFAGEGHGFRGADAIRRSLEGELSFLAAVFGYTRPDETEPLEVVGLDAWRARRAAGPAATSA